MVRKFKNCKIYVIGIPEGVKQKGMEETHLNIKTQ